MTVLVQHSMWDRFKKRWFNGQTVMGYLCILPILAAFGLYTVYPVISSLLISLTEWNGYAPVKEFVGGGNYVRIAHDPKFWQALKVTVYYTVGHLPLTMAAGLALALLVNRGLRGKAFYRTAYYLPSITPTVAASIIWVYVLNGQWGILNWLLSFVGINGPNWLNDANWSMPAVILFSVWKGSGYHMVVFLAGLQSVPQHLYEVARIDGAGRWGLFRHVTWPLLSPTTFFLFIQTIISSFKVFNSVYVMTQGGPIRSTTVIVYMIFQYAFEFFEMGYACALAYILFLIILILTIIQFRTIGQRVHYGG